MYFVRWFCILAMTLLLPAGSAFATLYAIDEDTQQLYTINTATGAAAAVGALNASPSLSGMAYDLGVGVMYVSDITSSSYGLGTVDLATGAVTYIGDHVTTSNVWGLAYDSTDDVLYGADQEGNGLTTIDRGSGASASVGPFGLQDTVQDLTYDAGTGTLYAITPTALYTVNQATGTATLVGAFASEDDMESLAWDDATNTLYGGSDAGGNLYEIDPGTGAESLIGSSGISLDAIEIVSAAAAVLPEPIPALGGLGLVLLAGFLGIAGLVGVRLRA